MHGDVALFYNRGEELLQVWKEACSRRRRGGIHETHALSTSHFRMREEDKLLCLRWCVAGRGGDIHENACFIAKI